MFFRRCLPIALTCNPTFGNVRSASSGGISIWWKLPAARARARFAVMLSAIAMIIPVR